jgi:hypothetical protein
MDLFGLGPTPQLLWQVGINVITLYEMRLSAMTLAVQGKARNIHSK